MQIIREFAFVVGEEELAINQSAAMNQLIEQLFESFLIRESFPSVEPLIKLVISRHFRAAEKILIGQREKRRYPRF